MLKQLLWIIPITCILSCTPEKEQNIDALNFETLQELAIDSDVRFYMWGGSEKVNSWIDGYLSESLKEKYQINLIRIPMDASIFVNKLLTEKSAGKNVGDIDLVWINGENFKNAKLGGVLYGPYLDRLPNYKRFMNPSSAASDSGFPVDGYEVPYGKAQFNYIYDSSHTSPPNNFNELLSWVEEYPGLFTYPSPPDFTGSAFIRQAFYALTGGFEQYMDGFSQELFNKNAPKLWDYLNRIEPFLWEGGQNYPKDLAGLDRLFERGEVVMTMSFTQTTAQSRINDGIYPPTVKSHVFGDGSLANTHFTAIPYNAPNKAGALVVSNHLISPEVQYSKNTPDNWGDFSVLDMSKLDSSSMGLFKSLNLGEATVDLDLLSSTAVPEISSEYWEALEEGWKEHVLKK